MRTELTHAAELSLWVYGDKVQIIATNPGWHMQPGRTVAVTVSVDGDTFRGSGSIENSTRCWCPT